MGPSAKVLVVDDDPLIRRSLLRVLSRSGFDVAEASNGEQAARLITEQEFDVIVSDIAMPDMDGMKLLERVHEHDSDLPVMLLTGNPELDTAMKAVEYGAFQYLKKPVEDAALVQSVTRAVNQRRTTRERQRALDAMSSAPPGEVQTGPRVWTNAVLAGRYRVGALIGEGGMGAVYEAVREDLAQMPVAIKILHPVLIGREDQTRRFRREAEIVAALDHPNIVKVVDYQSPPSGPVFLVMERLHGTSLGAVLARERSFAPERAVFIVLQVLSALEAAHAANVIHRDLKPDNVFLTSVAGLGDIVKLLDFGIAKLAETTSEQQLTATGLVLGTPPYMAPEYAITGRADTRADIYAAGCLLYEMLSGRQPYTADNYNALMFAIQTKAPDPIAALCPALSRDLVAVVEKAMTKDPDQRFATAAEMAAALEPWTVPSLSVRRDPEPAGDLGSAPTQLAATPLRFDKDDE
jgi:CheY-like chemotaxis protein